MNEFTFNRKRIVYGILGSVVFFVFSLWFICAPEIFRNHFLMNSVLTQIFGFIASGYYLLTLYSFVGLLFRGNVAFIISDSYLVDNSRFESIGKIYFNEICKIKRIKQHSLEITLIEPIFKSRSLNVLQKILLIANNWNPKNTIVVSSLMFNCDRETLRRAILEAMGNAKRPKMSSSVSTSFLQRVLQNNS